jgi:16S rRNA (cytidine1402-2'-O)-methyltransferase
MNEDTPAGTLYVVATPIGNLEDITLRALRILREVRVIAAEDTRHTRKLLSHYDIHTPMMSCHEYSSDAERGRLVTRLLRGDDVAVVTDAGTPGVSDPGAALMRDATAAGAVIVPVPGPSALLAALVGSGLPMDRFRFEGFLPRKGAERKAAIHSLQQCDQTVVLFEAPGRVAKTIRDLAEALGPRPACAARELTKIHEEFIRAPLDELCDRLPDPLRGEWSLVIGGAGPVEEAAIDPEAWRAELARLLAAGESRRDAARAVSEAFGINRKEAYAAATNDER